jgi:hypothetical protein
MCSGAGEGRTYNATGEGDSEMDAGTICFAEPNVNGEYFNEAEYRALYRLAPNIQHALEAMDGLIGDARKELQRKIEQANKQLPQ